MIKFLYISWNSLHRKCFCLAKKLLGDKLQADRIIAISRGGLVVSRVFSDYLSLPISSFSIVAYASIGKRNKPKIVEGLKVNIKGEKILLIDEVADSGETFKTALTYLKRFKPKEIFTLAPFIKPWTEFKPDFWQTKTKKWIIFPYDVKETILELKEKLKLADLRQLGLAKEQVDYFLKLKQKG